MQIRAVRSERMAAEVVAGNRMEADYPPNNSFVHAQAWAKALAAGYDRSP
jgi:hypothetical protein